jgi:hypothetical protein
MFAVIVVLVKFLAVLWARLRGRGPNLRQPV